jgi:hypothetical protein
VDGGKAVSAGRRRPRPEPAGNLRSRAGFSGPRDRPASRLINKSPDLPAGHAVAGRMFALRWKRFAGSYSALIRLSRWYFSARSWR